MTTVQLALSHHWRVPVHAFAVLAEDDVQIVGTRLGADDADRPAVVLVHGLMGWHAKPKFAVFAEHLTEWFTVYAFDTRGHGGSGGVSDQLKDVVNQGSSTYHGVLTWHVTATDVTTDTQGNTTETPLDFYIGQSQALIYGYKETFNDPANSITLSFEQVLVQFGKKVSVPTPKIGATTP